MQTTKSRLLHDSLRRYLRMGAFDHIDKLIAKTRDEELAVVLGGFSEDSQRSIFERLPDNERKANVIVQMEPSSRTMSRCHGNVSGRGSGMSAGGPQLPSARIDTARPGAGPPSPARSMRPGVSST